jgi:hypothetical protein
LRAEYERAVADAEAVGERLRNSAQLTEDDQEAYRAALAAEGRALQAYTRAMADLAVLERILKIDPQ